MLCQSMHDKQLDDKPHEYLKGAAAIFWEPVGRECAARVGGQ